MTFTREKNIIIMKVNEQRAKHSKPGFPRPTAGIITKYSQ
jgi:hypothetical protein